jgi:hypothetical protein
MLYQQHESLKCELKLRKEDFIKMVANYTYIIYRVKWLFVCVRARVRFVGKEG